MDNLFIGGPLYYCGNDWKQEMTMNKKWLYYFGLVLWLIAPTLYATSEEEEEEEAVVKKSVVWSNGDHYKGDYVGNQRTGKGTYVWANGDRYQGEFFEGKPDGVGEYIWANGDLYKGEYLEGKRDGNGVYVWANRDRFDGNFYEGKRGNGKLTSAPKSSILPKTTAVKADTKRLSESITDSSASKSPNSTTTQIQSPQTASTEKVPSFVRSKLSESVKITDSQVAKRESPADSNQPSTAKSTPLKFNGKLTVTWPTGDRYEGEYRNGIRTGKGLYLWPNGDRYEGELMEGVLEGEGMYSWVSGDRYVGKYVKGKRHDDQGVYIWANGDRYEGSFVAGQRTGKGILIWADGESYEGDFINSKRSGKGVYINLSGDRYEGEFFDGKRTGKGVLILINGEAPQLSFSNDSTFVLQELEFKNGALVSANGQYTETIETNE